MVDVGLTGTHGITGEKSTFEHGALLNKLNMLLSVKVYITTFELEESYPSLTVDIHFPSIVVFSRVHMKRQVLDRSGSKFLNFKFQVNRFCFLFVEVSLIVSF